MADDALDNEFQSLPPSLRLLAARGIARSYRKGNVLIEGIEFRAVTLVAFKGYGKECIDRGHAVIYRGPYAEVRDEEGHVFPRGERIAVCERTFRALTEGPYRRHFIGIEPRVLTEPVAWCAPPNTRRSPAETKGGRQVIECGGEKCC